jgi:hypothetical protein
VVLADVVAVVTVAIAVVVFVACCLASLSFFLPVMVVPRRRRFSCRWRGGGEEQGHWRLSPSCCMSYCTINVVSLKKKKKKSERKTHKGLKGQSPLEPRPSQPSLCMPFPALVIDLIAASWWPRFTCSEGLSCGRWATCVGGGIWCWCWCWCWLLPALMLAFVSAFIGN